MAKSDEHVDWRGIRYRGAYDSVVAAYADPKLEFIQKHARFGGKRVLDVGCGNGVFTVRLDKAARFVVGVDLSTHMLMENPHPLCVRGSAGVLPFKSGSFDVVFEANLLHLVEDYEGVLRELCRCSARYIVLIEPNWINPLMCAFALLVSRERGLLHFSKGRIRRLAEKMGLRILGLTATGMISQNNTPACIIPLLRRFDRGFFLGEYVVLCAEKKEDGAS